MRDVCRSEHFDNLAQSFTFSTDLNSVLSHPYYCVKIYGNTSPESVTFNIAVIRTKKKRTFINHVYFFIFASYVFKRSNDI